MTLRGYFTPQWSNRHQPMQNCTLCLLHVYIGMKADYTNVKLLCVCFLQARQITDMGGISSSETDIHTQACAHAHIATTCFSLEPEQDSE